MSDETAAPDLDQQARDVLDSVRYVVLGTIDEDGRTRTSPVYFVPHGYQDLYWVSNPASHHSHNLGRDNRLSGVVFDSTVAPSPGYPGAVYVTGTAREVPAGTSSSSTCRRPSTRARGGRAFTAEELTGDANIRLWVLHVEQLGGAHPRQSPDSRRRNGSADAGRSASRLIAIRLRQGRESAAGIGQTNPP